MTPPKPEPRDTSAGLWRLIALFRRDLLSALPARLYHAWMAEYRTPFFHSFLCNDPALVDLVLRERPMDFPKSPRLRAGLAPLLRNSVFVTNGETWARQRRIIDPAFDTGRLHGSFPAMWAAGEACLNRLRTAKNPVEIEHETAHAAADVIFRTLFSIPIEDETAAAVFTAFRAHQRTQPILNARAFLPWLPRLHSRRTRRTAAHIRALIARLTEARARDIAAGTAPDDLATRIMTTPDPDTGKCFDTEEMIDQVAIFFLAGHETSASALAWALWLMATHPEWQDRVASEAQALRPDFATLATLRLSRAVFRETLRLYPPVPMFVREATCPETFRGRPVPKGAQVVISPWHLHRHERLWDNPDGFDPGRWLGPCPAARQAYIPFSAGARICPGAGFAMAEGPLLLSMILRDFHIAPARAAPVPVAHLTVHSRDGIWLTLTPRADRSP
ncbi:cytochrome P450 [Paenirhodobacter sp.]|uniref:cytochrome P450 n=1 Tax=Paenirhodobacter sp. TaxID=1965326 RepID=UPI003B3CCEBA